MVLNLGKEITAERGVNFESFWTFFLFPGERILLSRRKFALLHFDI